MAVWQIVIEKQLGTEYWVNDYHVQSNDALNVVTQVGIIANLERSITTELVTFTKARYRPAGSTAQGTVIPLGFLGLAAAPPNYLPLYNTVRVDFAPASGRPGRKYLRLPLGVGAVVGSNLSSGAVSLFNSSYAAPMVALGYVCKENGDLFVSAATQGNVQMRQLRRGSKRRLQPII